MYGNCLLHTVVYCCEQCDAMMDHGCALQRGTALTTACQRGHLDVVKALLAHGAHVNLGDDKV